jgi:hypothetical protein
MLRTAAIASLCILNLVPACDGIEGDDHEAETDTDTDTDGETDGMSESGADAPLPDEEIGESSVTPLVLAFAGEAVQFNTAVAAAFDLGGTMSVVTDWPTSTTPWLALDRNGNGRVDDGGELFGSATLLRSGELADNGFTALRELDSNLDGRIDARDAQWGRLLVWSDVDSDRVSAADELKTVGARDLVAIELDYAVDRRCDGRGNCEVERAQFLYRVGAREIAGAVVDVHLRAR